jgi:TolB protein
MSTRARSLALIGFVALLAGCGGQEGPSTQASEGGRIIFTINTGSRGELWAMDETGTERRRLTDGSSAAWSPKRDRIAFVGSSDADDEDADRRELYVMDADGGNLKRVTSNEDADASPSWSPDGERLVFARAKRTGRADVETSLYVMNADGSGERMLRREPRAQTPVFLAGPAWSPDGKRIAFTRIRFDQTPDAAVYVMDADGGRATKIADEAVEPDWSPDSRRIALASYRDRLGRTCFQKCSPNSEIYVVDADGGRMRRLTESDANDASPTWSPDGKRIVFVSDRSNRTEHELELYVVDAAGGDPRRLTRNDAWELDPDWN